jgi:hypothetical protein
MRYVFLFAALIGLGSACQERAVGSLRPYELESNIDPRKDPQLLFQVDSLLPRVDSMVFVYFDDPFGKDSLRYTRFYTQFSWMGMDSTSGYIQPMNESVKAVESKRNCRIEGKIWCYSAGKMVQTIYWASQPTGCRFQYLIRDGLFYYVSLTDQQFNWLNQFRTRAKKPSPASVSQ